MSAAAKPVHVTELRAERFKRLTAVRLVLEPTGALTVIGGANGAGKSSTLDALWAALGGKTAVPDVAVRQGEAGGFAEVSLDNGLIVRRTFTAAGGGVLTVTSADGLRYPSPQALLDGLVGALSFDPLGFCRQSAREQAETLRAVTGLDLGDIDARRRALYEERTAAGRALRAATAKVEALGPEVEAPDEEVSTAEIVREVEAARATNARHAAERAKVERLAGQADAAGQRLAAMDEQIRRLREQRTVAVDEAAVILGQLDAQRAVVAGLVDAVVPDAAGAIAGVEAINREVRANRARTAAAAEAAELSERVAGLTASRADLDAERASRIAAAPLPVPGLGLDPDGGGVTLDGLPFAQASQAQQLRVSLAMASALSPALRVVLVRDGSLLDADNLALVATFAREHDLQILLERVGAGPEVGVVIEDGEIRQEEIQRPSPGMEG